MSLSGRTLSAAGIQLSRGLRHPEFRLSATRPGSGTTSSSSTQATTFSTGAKLEAGNEDAGNKDEIGRSDINTDRNEYTKSGTDSQVAKLHSAWDLHNTTPESVREASSRESNGGTSPLEVSPANQEVSSFTDENGKGESVVHGPSRRVSPRKGKKVDYGGAAVESHSEQESH